MCLCQLFKVTCVVVNLTLLVCLHKWCLNVSLVLSELCYMNSSQLSCHGLFTMWSLNVSLVLFESHYMNSSQFSCHGLFTSVLSKC